MKAWMLIFLVGCNLYTQRGFALASNYEQEIAEWRTQQEKNLRSESSWLTVVGLWWLQAGDNSVGAGSNKQVQLPVGVPENLGVITWHKEQLMIRFTESEQVSLDHKVVVKGQSYPLQTDDAPQKTLVNIGKNVEFFIIKRPNGMGVRVKDKESEARKNFKGRAWYPAQKNFVIEASWVALPSPKEIVVPDVLGNKSTEKVTGYVSFQKDGKTYHLYPNSMEDGLFFVFRDATSGKGTYGAGRFLSTELPNKQGKVILDFNKAVSPPCAFTHFATCPLPPKENILPMSIEAGEKF